MKKLLTFPVLIRAGLACVFLANSLTAFLAPGEFQDLVSHSFVAGLLPISVASFVTFIGFNDLTVAILLFLGWRTSRVAVYATAWLTGVVFVIGVFTFDALEHLGFIAMAIALAARRGAE
ncbi:MAG: hypothetical protein ACYC6X_00730 [Minisyncoccota bacterium]